METHCYDCEYTPVICPYKCKDAGKEVWILKKEVTQHISSHCSNRSITCPNGCKKTFKQCHLDFHNKKCPKVNVLCTNEGCGMSVLREGLSKHFNSCPHEKTVCKYRSIGCTATPPRKDVNKHESDDQFHLHLAIDTISRMQEQIQSMASTQTNTFTFQMQKFHFFLESRRVFCSPPFYSHFGGYRLCIKVCANGIGPGYGTHVSVYAYFMRGHYDDILEWPFRGEIVIKLLNQREDKNHVVYEIKHEKNAESNERVTAGEISGKGCGSSQFISHVELGIMSLRAPDDVLYDTPLPYTYIDPVADKLYFSVTVKPKASPKPWLSCTI